MPIEFTCPNGHRLSTPVDHAGRMAKCPRCGSVTRVPDLDGEGSRIVSAEPAPSSSGKMKAVSNAVGNGPGGSGVPLVGGDMPATPEAGGSWPGPSSSNTNNSLGVAPASDSGKAAVAKPGGPREPQIVFLCPNGHKLNAPRRLQGHAGKCPHCGEKFRIPTLDEPDAAAAPADPLPSLPENGMAPDVGNIYQDILEQAAAPAAPTTGAAHPIVPPADDSVLNDPNCHALARLVIRLWSEREHGGIVELHLAGGAILVPEWFERHLSQASHGLFATQAADGTVTMTIVPWDTITRVVVRGVVGLPDGMFE